MSIIKSKKEGVGLIAIGILLWIAVIVIIFNPFGLGIIESGIRVEYDDACLTERLETDNYHFFDGGIMLFKFIGLNVTANYSLYKMTITKEDFTGVLIHSFVGNETEFLFLRGEWSHYYLFRGDVIIMFIECIPEEMGG